MGDSVLSDESFCKINEFLYYIYWCKIENVSKSKIFCMFFVWYFRLKFYDKKNEGWDFRGLEFVVIVIVCY